MKTTQKRYTGEFKARVALEAIRGDLNVGGVGGQAGHPPHDDCDVEAAGDRGHGGDVLGRWRSGQGRRRGRSREAAREDGQLVVERDFLSKGFAR